MLGADNTSGQLGVEINNEITEDGTAIEDSRSLPVEVDLTDGVDFTEITDIAAGKNHTVIVLNNDTVYTWGDNTYGQLGNDKTTATISTPVHVKSSDGTYLTGISMVSGGANHVIAMSNTNDIYAWGDNSKAQYHEVANTHVANNDNR